MTYHLKSCFHRLLFPHHLSLSVVSCAELPAYLHIMERESRSMNTIVTAQNISVIHHRLLSNLSCHQYRLSCHQYRCRLLRPKKCVCNLLISMLSFSIVRLRTTLLSSNLLIQEMWSFSRWPLPRCRGKYGKT